MLYFLGDQSEAGPVAGPLWAWSGFHTEFGGVGKMMCIGPRPLGGYFPTVGSYGPGQGFIQNLGGWGK